MSRKAAAGILISFLLLSSGAAISFDTFVDGASCVSAMTSPFMGSVCAISTFDDIISGGPDDVQNDIYTKTAFVKDARDRVITEQKSQLNQTYGLAMSDAKLEIIKGLNNELSQSDARQEGFKEVEELYSSYEMRLVAQQNREVLKLNESRQQIQATSGLAFGDVFKVREAVNDQDQWVAPRDFKIVESNYTLHNGTTVDKFQAKALIQTYEQSGSDSFCSKSSSEQEWINLVNTTSYNLKSQEDSGACQTNFEKEVETIVRTENTDGERRDFLHGSPFVRTFSDVNSMYQDASSQVSSLADSIYGNYNPGGINASDVCGPLCSLKQASTNYEDTGAYSYLSYSLYQMGLASNETSAFELEIPSRNLTATGQLFLETEAWNSTTIEVGETYDASGKPAWFVYKPENKAAKKIELNGNFTVKQMWNTRTSEQVNSTSVQNTEFYTSSTDSLQSQLEEHQETIDLIVEMPESPNGSAGGSTGLFGLSAMQTGGIVVILLLLAFVLGVIFSVL